MALRVGIGALLLAVLIAAFSLRTPPTPLTADLAADTVDAPGGLVLLDQLVQRYPDRRPGSVGDSEMAQRVEAELKARLPAGTVTTDEFTADTPDGSRTLRNVVATVPGQPGNEIVVLASRDALRRGSSGEMSATAGLLTIARAIGAGRFSHTIRFVSTTAGSGGGNAGAARFASRSGGSTAAVIVLGDLSGAAGRDPRVVPWSTGGRSAPLRLTRTVEHALREERLSPVSTDGLWTQLAHRTLPGTTGAQGVLNQRGIAAVLLAAGGTTPATGDEKVNGAAFTAYVRSALRSLRAIDEAPGALGPQQSGIVILDSVLPGWAVRLLVLALVLPLVGGVVVAILTLARDGHPLAAGAGSVAGCAAGPLLAGMLALFLGRIDLVWPATPGPLDGTAVRTGPWAGAAVVLLTAILVAGIAVARPLFTRDAAGPARPTRVGITTAVFTMVLLVLVVLLVLNPVGALLVLPAAVAWPAAIAPIPGIQPLHRVLLTVAGAALPVAAAITVIVDLELPIVQVPWSFVLVAASGHTSPVGILLVSVLGGALIATALTLVPVRRRTPVGRDGRRGPGGRGPSDRDPDPATPDSAPSRPPSPEGDRRPRRGGSRREDRTTADGRRRREDGERRGAGGGRRADDERRPDDGPRPDQPAGDRSSRDRGRERRRDRDRGPHAERGRDEGRGRAADRDPDDVRSRDEVRRSRRRAPREAA
ncbi:MAG: hypothetical protein AB7G37_19170 [Solirubrobacteraceae bacterium]